MTVFIVEFSKDEWSISWIGAVLSSFQEACDHAFEHLIHDKSDAFASVIPFEVDGSRGVVREFRKTKPSTIECTDVQ